MLVPRPAAAEGEVGGYQGYRIVRFAPATPEEARRLAAAVAADGLEAFDHGCHEGAEGEDARAGGDYLLSPSQWAELSGLGIAATVLVEDVQAQIDAEAERLARPRLRGVGEDWFADFHDDAEVSARVDQLVADHPTLVSRLVLGSTLEGRALYAVMLTAPPVEGEGMGGRPIVFITAGQHAREWITVSSAMYIIDTLASTFETDPEVRALLEQFRVVVVPVVNRDGYVYTWLSTGTSNRLWRKNKRRLPNGVLVGVDLNRNWPYAWGGPGSTADFFADTYRGASALSEPETAAIAAWVTGQDDIALHIDLHSYGQYVLEPWGWTPDEPADREVFAEGSRVIDGGIFGVDGTPYSVGATHRLLYPASGTLTDWMYGGRGVLSWTIELRDTSGFIVPPEQIVPTGREALGALMQGAAWLQAQPLIVRSERPLPGAITEGVGEDVDFWVHGGMKRLQGPPRVWSAVVSAGFASSMASLPPPKYMPVEVTHVSGALWRAHLPSGACGEATLYVFEADTAGGGVLAFPAAGPLEPLMAVAQPAPVVFADDFEVDRGWTIGAPGDTVAGQWGRGDPSPSATQPDFDHSALGKNCMYTAAGDVDDGVVTLTSPRIDLSAAPEARVSYWRWFLHVYGVNDPGDDALRAYVSNDDGQTWVLAERTPTTGPETHGGWIASSWRVADFVTPTAGVRVRFTASDLGDGGTVEAAVDDFLVSVPPEACGAAACVADFNRVNGVSVQDLFDFLTAWLDGNPAADVNGVNGVSVQDIFDFLTRWLAGC